MKGDGTLFLRGGVYYGTYNAQGRRFKRSLKTQDEDTARKRLQAMRRDAERGDLKRQRGVTVRELLDDLLVYLKLRGAASRAKVASHVKSLRRAFGFLPAHALDTATVERYQQGRLTAGRKPATVNRACEALRQAYNLAARRTPPKVRAVPHIPLLRVENARQGFLSSADFEKLLAAIPAADVRDYVEWFWWTGMRPNEIRQLTWEMFDREGWTLTLAPQAEKTRKGRVIPIVGPLREILERRLLARRLGCALIFHRTSKGRTGQPVRDFRLRWRAALKTAKLPAGLIPYDLRRSALRNMIRSGTDFTVAMKISGHRTRATFDRYNIVDEEDIRDAVVRAGAYVRGLGADKTGRSRMGPKP